MTRIQLPPRLTILILALLPGSLPAQDPDPFVAFRGEAEELVRKAMEHDRVPGMSLLVAFGETIVLAKGYGMADVENEVPVTPESVFQIGSITKQFTAAAIMKLVDAGKLRLDDKLADLLPNYPFSSKDVTVHQLLNHTSGITSFTRFRQKLSELEYRRFSHRDFYDVIAKQAFEFEPGTGWKYSNSGYYLLGMIIEKVTGRKYDAFLAEKLWRKSGMTATYYGNMARIIPHRVRGYDVSLFLRQVQNARGGLIGQAHGAGAMMSTTRDLHRWNLALHGGRLLAPDSYTKMTTPTGRGTADRPHTYGYGLNIHDRDGRRVFVHGGGIPGFRSFNAFFHKSRLSVVLLCNNLKVGAGPVVLEIAEAALAVER